MTEQLALQEFSRNSAAVDGNKGFLSPRRKFMQAPRHELLAGPRFSQYQHRADRGRNLANHALNGTHGGGLPRRASSGDSSIRNSLRVHRFTPRCGFMQLSIAHRRARCSFNPCTPHTWRHSCYSAPRALPHYFADIAYASAAHPGSCEGAGFYVISLAQRPGTGGIALASTTPKATLRQASGAHR